MTIFLKNHACYLLFAKLNRRGSKCFQETLRACTQICNTFWSLEGDLLLFFQTMGNKGLDRGFKSSSGKTLIFFRCIHIKASLCCLSGFRRVSKCRLTRKKSHLARSSLYDNFWNLEEKFMQKRVFFHDIIIVLGFICVLVRYIFQSQVLRCFIGWMCELSFEYQIPKRLNMVLNE